MPPDDNGWNEWQKHVLAELKRMNGWLMELQRQFDNTRVGFAADISSLKAKVATIGAAWGLVAGVAAALAVKFLTGE